MNIAIFRREIGGSLTLVGTQTIEKMRKPSSRNSQPRYVDTQAKSAATDRQTPGDGYRSSASRLAPSSGSLCQ